MAGLNLLAGPAWPGVQVRFTTRAGGASQAPFDSLNLGRHVGDDPAAVAENRRRAGAQLPGEPLWLDQVHGTRVWLADEAPPPASGMVAPPQADAAITATPGRVLAIMVADCLPVAITDRAGTVLGVAHAGWRGLADGVLEATVAALRRASPGADGWQAWIGPAIGPAAFEVGRDVRDIFLAQDPQAAACFTPRAGRDDKWLADLPALAARRLQGVGVAAVAACGQCTHSDPARFFSYRRDGACGRMALFAWIG